MGNGPSVTCTRRAETRCKEDPDPGRSREERARTSRGPISAFPIRTLELVPRCPMSPSAMQELPFPSCIRRFSPRTFASLRFAICPAIHAFLHVYRNQALALVAMQIHLQLAPIMRATQGHPHVEQTWSWRTLRSRSLQHMASCGHAHGKVVATCECRAAHVLWQGVPFAAPGRHRYICTLGTPYVTDSQ